MHKKVQEILDFWFKETPPKKRFQKHKDFIFTRNEEIK